MQSIRYRSQYVSSGMIIITIVFYFGLPILPAFAQGIDTNAGGVSEESNQNPPPPIPTPPSIPESNTPGAVSCFDYYTFGSVQVDAAPYFTDVNPTDPVLFGGVITNNNPYPIVDGQVWMKVFKNEQKNDAFLKENGYPMIDFVLVQDKVVIPAHAEIPLEFSWTAPANVAGGTYQSAFFFTTAHRYNLLGLSFTDDVTGNTASFTINRTTEYSPVVFDKNSVHLNDVRTSFALPPRHFTETEQVVAYATLVNPSKNDRSVELTWTTYKWDGILEAFKQDTESTAVVVPAGKRIEVGHMSPTIPSSVTFIQASVQDGDAKSILHIRYVRDGIAETRINFPSVMSYPLVAGKEMTVFSCVHSTNLPVVNGNTLTLTLKDVAGDVLHTYTYTGDVTGAMMAVKDTYVPDKNYGTFSLTASLTRDGKIIEEVTTTYTCSDIDESQCTENDVVHEKITVTNSSRLSLYVWTTVLSLLLLMWLLRYRRRQNESMNSPKQRVSSN